MIRRAFHGTPWPGFKEFRLAPKKRQTEHETNSLGLWFTSDPDVASEFASVEQRAGALKRGDWGHGGPRLYPQTRTKHGAVIRAAVRFRNPKVYQSRAGSDAFDAMRDDMDEYAEYIDRRRGRVPKGYWRKGMIAFSPERTARLFREALQRQGYDGILLLRTEVDGVVAETKRIRLGRTLVRRRPHDVMCVFDPKQVLWPGKGLRNEERPGLRELLASMRPSVAAHRARPAATTANSPRTRPPPKKRPAKRPPPCRIVFTGEGSENEHHGGEELFGWRGVNIASYEESLFACVDEDGATLGALVAGLTPPHDGRMDFRFSVAVDPDAERRGIARGLVHAAMKHYLAERDDWAQAYGAWPEMVAWVINPNMALLLEDLGFDSDGSEWSPDNPMMGWSG